MTNAIRCRLLLVVLVCGTLPHHLLAQSKLAGVEKSPLCTRDNALEMILDQVALTKTIDNKAQRITVLIRAADLLWVHDQSRARSLFTQAFDLAVQNERENERKGPQVLLLRLRSQDQRYIVIRAVAKKDSAWARELVQKILKNEEDSASTRRTFEDSVTAARLLDSAIKLLATDINAALNIARVSFNYPASSWLTRFLYNLAKLNQPAADQFYSQALSVYRERPMREFLYLQAYPFAMRETLNTPIFSFYEVPSNFVTNQNLQRGFVQSALRRAQDALETPPDETDVYRHSNGTLMPGKIHLLLTLKLLESPVKESLPDLWPALSQVADRILVSLPVDTQEKLQQPGRDTTSLEQPFDEEIEAALKEPDVDERNNLIGTAVIGAATDKGTSVSSVVAAIDKISDSALRDIFFEWFYFQRASLAVKEKQFEEAERLTTKVDGLNQRSFLHGEIAKGLLSVNQTQIHGRDVLDEAVNEARKAGVSITTARRLLALSNLYAKIDMGQSISLLTDAVNCINRIENPDFVSDDEAIRKAPERKRRGGQYAGEFELAFYMPGLDPESAFREMAKLDFDTVLSQSSGLTDKFQRAMSTLGLVEVCLQQPPKIKPHKRAQS